MLSSLIIAALVGIAQAQTPPGFKPEVKTKLDVMFNSTMLKTPGERLMKTMTQSEPQIALPVAAMQQPQATFMFVMLDLDVMAGGGMQGGNGKGKAKERKRQMNGGGAQPGNGTRQALLHALNAGYKASTQKMGDANLLTSTEKGPAMYLSPNPPATDTMPHRYVELLFEQPAAFKVDASAFQNTQSRMNFNIENFMKMNNLKEPIAANYFTVDGRAATGPNMGGAGPTGKGPAPPSSTTVPFKGDARKRTASYGLTGLLGGLAMIAV